MKITIRDEDRTCNTCGGPALFVIHGNVYHINGSGLYGDGIWLKKTFLRPEGVPMTGYCKKCFVGHLNTIPEGETRPVRNPLEDL